MAAASRPCPVAAEATSVGPSTISEATATGGVPLRPDQTLGTATCSLVIPLSPEITTTYVTAFLSVASGIDAFALPQRN